MPQEEKEQIASSHGETEMIASGTAMDLKGKQPALSIVQPPVGPSKGVSYLTEEEKLIKGQPIDLTFTGLDAKDEEMFKSACKQMPHHAFHSSSETFSEESETESSNE